MPPASEEIERRMSKMVKKCGEEVMSPLREPKLDGLCRKGLSWADRS